MFDSLMNYIRIFPEKQPNVKVETRAKLPVLPTTGRSVKSETETDTMYTSEL